MKKLKTRKCQFLLPNFTRCGKKVKKGNRFLCPQHAREIGDYEYVIRNLDQTQFKELGT